MNSKERALDLTIPLHRLVIRLNFYLHKHEETHTHTFSYIYILYIINVYNIVTWTTNYLYRSAEERNWTRNKKKTSAINVARFLLFNVIIVYIAVECLFSTRIMTWPFITVGVNMSTVWRQKTKQQVAFKKIQSQEGGTEQKMYQQEWRDSCDGFFVTLTIFQSPLRNT